MKTYLILPNEEDKEHVREYIKDKKINIQDENLLTVQDSNKYTYPSILFIVEYDSTKKAYLKLSSENRKQGGYNISIGGDNNIFYIDKYIDKPYPAEMNFIIKKFENVDKLESKYSEEVNDGKILTITSAKGGVGKSFLTLNLGYIMSKIKHENKKCIIVDYNLSEGSLSRFFHEFWNNGSRIDNIFDSFNNLKEIDKEYLIDTIVKNPKLNYSNEQFDGIDILLAPDNFSLTPKKINRNSIFTEKLFDSIKSLYDIIIVDTSNEKNIDVNEYLIKNSDKIIFVTSTSPNSVIQLKEYIDELSIPKEKYDIVYNDYNKMLEIMDTEKVVSSLFSLDQNSKSYKRDLKEILDNKFFIFDSNIGIKKADHNFDIIFSNKKYISSSDLIKYKSIFYNIAKSNFRSCIKSLDDNKSFSLLRIIKRMIWGN